MKLIVSAWQEQNPAHENARRTKIGLIQIHGTLGNGQCLQTELCIGNWKGTRELSTIVTGFTMPEEMLRFANQWMADFGQESVYAEVAGQGTLLLANELHGGRALGRELNCIKASWEGPLPACYTETFDGRMIVALGGL